MSAVAEASPSIRARDNLSALGLHEMAAALPDYVRMVAAGERDFCSALEEMTRVEVAAREARIVRQRIRSSGFPYVKGLADFDWDFQPSVPRARVEELATLRFIERAENVLLVGSPGVGKTHLAVAIGIEAVRAGREVRFMDCARLVEDLQDAQARGIKNGDIVSIHSRRGQVYSRADVSDRINKGTVYMTYQWWIGKCNELTMHKVDPVSHTPEDKFSACQVDAIADQVWAEGEVERQYTELKQALVDAAAPQDVEPGAAKFDDETHVNQIV